VKGKTEMEAVMAYLQVMGRAQVKEISVPLDINTLRWPLWSVS
jgi:hypothetical protein